MDARLSSASKRYQYALQSPSGTKWDGFDAEMLMGFEKFDVEDDIRDEYPCPFCSDYFDIVGLCCHIDDEHHSEANNGVCPVCAIRVGVDMVAHITMQHGSIFKIQRKRKLRTAGSLSFLRRELREGTLQSLFGESSCIVSSSNASSDPLLSSFILPGAEDYEGVPPCSSAETTSVKKSTTDSISERMAQAHPVSVEEQEKKTKRSDFVQGLLFSIILDDNL